MAAPKAVLAMEDHYILRMLIQGKSVQQVADLMQLGIRSLDKRLERMREFLEVESNYQLIAFEVINLMEATEEDRNRLLGFQPPALRRAMAAKA